MFRVLRRDFDLLNDEIAVHGLGCEARDGLFPLSVEVAKSLRWPFPPACRAKGCFMRRARGVPQATFSPYPTRKRLIFPFLKKMALKHRKTRVPPACGGKVGLSAACGRLFPLPVEEKVISWTWCAAWCSHSCFPPRLSTKNDSWTWRALAMGFSSLPVEEKGTCVIKSPKPN